MKIVRKSKMPDGTDIQIEDWKDVYEFMKVYSIATYPKAKNSSKYGFIENNKNFRLELTRFESNEQAEEMFKKLEQGSIKLNELSNYFLDIQKYMYYLGMTDTEEIVEQDEEELSE